MPLYKQVLLVDDDEDDRALFLDEVKKISPDMSVISAFNGQDACKKLITALQAPQLIFLDLNMPIMDGFEFLKMLKQDNSYTLYKDIPVIVFTTSHSEEAKCLALGALLYVPKPNSLDIFRDVVSTLLGMDITKDVELMRQLIKQKLQRLS